MYHSPSRRMGVLMFFAALMLVVAMACGSSDTTETAVSDTAAPKPTAVPKAKAEPTAAPVTSPAKVEQQGILNIGFKELFTFGNAPTLTESAVLVFVGSASGESLMKLNMENEIVPQLAEDWSLDDSGTVWTINLRDDVNFHGDWGPMTSDDVVFTMQEYAGDDSISSWKGVSQRLYATEGGGPAKVDDYTLTVDTVTPQFDFLYALVLPEHVNVISKAVFDTLGRDEATWLGIGTGPWKFEDQKAREYWLFSALEEHYRKAPHFAELKLHDIPEEATRVANFQTGKLDSFLMAFDSKPALDKVPGIQYMSVPNGSTAHLGLHPNHYVGMGEPDFEERRPGAFNCLKDEKCPWVSPNPDPTSPEWERARKVREALFISVDRQEIVDTLLDGEGSPQSLWVWENRQKELNPKYREWEFNPEKAKQLLIDAGYPDGFEIEITASIRGVAAEAESCEAVASWWNDIGVRTNINRVPYIEIGPRIQARSYVGLSCHGTGGRVDPATLMDIVYASHSGFSAGFDHPIFDDLIEKMMNIADDEGHWAAMNEMAAFIYENALDSGFYSVNILWPLGPKVQSWREHLQKGDTRSLGSYEYAKHRAD